MAGLVITFQRLCMKFRLVRLLLLIQVYEIDEEDEDSAILKRHFGFSSCWFTQERTHSLHKNEYTDNVSEHATNQSNCNTDEECVDSKLNIDKDICIYPCKHVGVF